jgi:hypothetical protein
VSRRSVLQDEVPLFILVSAHAQGVDLALKTNHNSPAQRCGHPARSGFYLMARSDEFTSAHVAHLAGVLGLDHVGKSRAEQGFNCDLAA